MNLIAYTNIDGATHIVNAASKVSIHRDLKRANPEFPDVWSDEDFNAFVKSKLPQNAANIIELTLEDLPSDREFRNAWDIQDAKIGYDLEKARGIQLERIRAARAPVLAELDKQFIIAQETQDAAALAEIVSKKQSLRNITEPLKTAILTSIDDVKAVFPDELKV